MTEQNPSRTGETPPQTDADIAAVARYAELPDGAAAELIAPLIRSYVARIRRHPRTDLFGDEPAFRFDPSWDDDPDDRR
jgi:hypothetical protein